MFKFFYSLIIHFYSFLVFLASIFNKKASLWIKGRKDTWKKLKDFQFDNEKVYWFHVASLGEFEQARPLIENIKEMFSDVSIVLTFFSPSGYEIRKNYKYADMVLYLPVDTKKNAKNLINKIKPQKVFFLKYDLWYFYLEYLNKKNIETYLISGIFRENQIFFKKIGQKYAKVLTFFTHIFVQNKQSAQLLSKIDINNVSVIGDTRFDRVIKISENSINLPVIKEFIKNKFCIVAGSTWQPDENLIIEYINESFNLKFIIAPHEVDENHIVEILQKINRPVVRYSKIKNRDLTDYQVLIIDNIGILSSIYKYVDLAYVGGGFNSGIHNIIEPAVYGMPVAFGPKHKKFQEAVDLIKLKAAFKISDYQELENYFNLFINDANFLEATSKKAKNYVFQNKGATDKVLKYVFRH